MSIVFENVGFSFGKKKVFDGFSLKIPDGARVSLMGESGSGKSTLLRLAAGLLAPQIGRITGVPERVGFVFQESRLVPQLTALENVLLVLDGAPDARDIALSLLTELGLGAETDALPASLSGGMARRVALARAVAYPSPLLLLDEAFTGLDEATRRDAAEVVLRHSEGRTILAATHSEAEAALLGAEIVHLDG